MRKQKMLKKCMAFLILACMLAESVPVYAAEDEAAVVEKSGQADNVDKTIEDGESTEVDTTEESDTDVQPISNGIESETSVTEIAESAQKNTGLEDTDFVELYIANLTFKEGSNPVNNGVPPYIDSVKALHEIGHPSAIVMRELNADDSFKQNLVMYDLLSFDPSKITGKMTSQKEYDMAILLSMLNIGLTDDKTVEAYNSKWAATQDDAMSWIARGLKGEYNIEVNSSTRIADIDKERLNIYYSKMMKDKYKMVDGFERGMQIFNIYADTLTTVQQLTNVVTSYICIYEMEAGIFDVLREMRKHTSDLNMRGALDEIISCENSVLSSVSNGIIDGGTGMFNQVYKNVVGSMWEDAALVSPFAPIYLAQKTSNAFCNLVLSTEGISEQYWKMDALCKAEEALYQAHKALGEKYVKNQTVENARMFNRSVDLWFNLYETSCDYAKAYGDIVNNNLASWLFGNKESYQAYTKAVDMMSSSARLTYSRLYKSYLNYLEVDYPELYKELGDMDAPVFVPVTGVKIDGDSLEWGTEDSFLNNISYTVSPSNATNQNVRISISDESILSYDGWGYKVKKAGDATITVTTVDGGYSDSILIHGVEGPGKDGLYLPPTPTKPPVEPDGELVDSGECGENMQWRLMSNGTLYIDGQGDVNHADWGRDCMKNVIISEGVTSINGYIFLSQSNLESVDLPRSLTSIGNSAFARCEKLKSIEISDGLKSIGREAFSGCKSLDEINLPGSLNSLGQGAFNDCSNLREINLQGEITEIGRSTFEGCTSLKKIDLSKSIERIDANAFYGCNSLSEINLPQGLKSIEEKTFYGCNSLSKISLPQGLKSIENHAFSGCRSLSKINIPKNLKSIGEGAFSGCGSLEKISMPKGLIKVESCLFSGCTSLNEINLSDDIKSIEEGAFTSCENLSKINLPRELESIGKEAFGYCKSLKKINLPEKLVSIGDGAFASCTNLVTINFSKGLTNIGNDTFSYCNNLIEVSLPEGIISIGENAFWYCKKLNTISLPETLTSIGKYAFYGCSSLVSVVLKSKRAPSASSDSFHGCNYKIRYYVPKNSTGYDVSPWLPNYRVVYGGHPPVVSCVKSVKLSATKYTYNGRTKKPTVTATDTDGKKISSKNYKVTYSKGCKNVGQYTVTVKFKGDYNGTVTKTFKIVPKGTSLSKLSAKKNGFKATWKKQATQTSGYEIQYAIGSKFADAEIMQVSGGKKTSMSVTELQAKKKYYVRIRTYKMINVDGESTMLYSSWSKAKKVKTK